MIDTHCHLAWADYDADRDAVIARATAAGITQILAIGAGQGMDGNAKAVALAERYPHIYAAVGLHPSDADLFTPHCLEMLEQLAAHPKVVAIGETGLDYHRAESNREKQHEAFAAQRALAQRLGLPIIIHQRDAMDDLLDVIARSAATKQSSEHHGIAAAAARPRNDTVHGVVHCFGGPLEFGQRLIELGFFLGIGGVVTFKNAHTLHDALRTIPLEHLVLETDAPFLAPVPYRGKRNEPAYVAHVAEAIAALKQCDPQDVARITHGNTERVFPRMRPSI